MSDLENGGAAPPAGNQTMYQKYKKFLIMVGAGSGLTIGMIAKAAGWSSDFKTIIGYPGELFINALMLMVVPYICAAMVASQRPDPDGDAQTAGMMKLGITAYGCTTTLAVFEALIFTNIFAPGASGGPIPMDPLGVGCQDPHFMTQTECVANMCACGVTVDASLCVDGQQTCVWNTGMANINPDITAVRDGRGRLFLKLSPSHEDAVALGSIMGDADGSCSDGVSMTRTACTEAHMEWSAEFGSVTDVVSKIPSGVGSLDAILSIGFQILPRNIFETFAAGNLLGLIVFSVLFGKALAKQGQKAEVIFDQVTTGTAASISYSGLSMRLYNLAPVHCTQPAHL